MRTVHDIESVDDPVGWLIDEMPAEFMRTRRLFKVSATTVGRILRGETWAR